MLCQRESTEEMSLEGTLLSCFPSSHLRCGCHNMAESIRVYSSTLWDEVLSGVNFRLPRKLLNAVKSAMRPRARAVWRLENVLLVGGSTHQPLTKKIRVRSVPARLQIQRIYGWMQEEFAQLCRWCWRHSDCEARAAMARHVPRFAQPQPTDSPPATLSRVQYDTRPSCTIVISLSRLCSRGNRIPWP
jgi:hypothetical protein